MSQGGFTPEKEAAYRAYVDYKWRQGLQARDRDGWVRAVDRMQGLRAYGDRFRDGMCAILGYTAEHGWVLEKYYPSPTLGRRFHDVANDLSRKLVEFKAGRVGRDALAQLAKDAGALRRGRTVEWYVRDMSLVHKEVRKELERLAERYPEKFHFREVPANEAERAMDLGMEIAKEREQAKAVQREIERLQPALDRMPSLDARGNLLNTLEGGALLQPGRETTQLALAQLQAEHQVMREEAHERVMLEQQLRDMTPRRDQPERSDEREPTVPEKGPPPLEFDSVERRTALAMHLAELGVEPELIEVRMLCELAQAQPPVEAARMPIEGPTKMRPHRELDERGRDRDRSR